MREEVLAQNSPNTGIRCLKWRKVLDDDEWSFDQVGGRFQRIRNRDGSVRTAGSGDKADRALRLEA